MKIPTITTVRRTACLVPAFTLLAVSSAFASTLHVAKDGVDDSTCGTTRANPCLTIQYSIDSRAIAGDLIMIGPGVYSELVNVDKNLTLRGSRFDRTIIDGAHNGTVVTVGSVFATVPVTASLVSLTIRNGFVSTFLASDTGGGIVNFGTLNLVESLVTDNSVIATDIGHYTPLAGGILNEGALTVVSSGIVANSASGGCLTAGGLETNGGSLSTKDSFIGENTVTEGGGCSGPSSLPSASGLFNLLTYPSVLTTTTFWKNGITNDGALTIDRSTIADSDGAGIVNGGGLTITNSTISGSSYVGILNVRSEFIAAFNMSNSTVSANSGGGVEFGAAFFSRIRNSILAGNSGSDCAGSFVSEDYNLIQNLAGCSFDGGGHDITGVSADLKPLGDYGGPTPTMDLMRDSPAINAGNPAGCMDSAGNPITVDQRGFPRPSPTGGRCDIGAVEVQKHHDRF